MDWNEGYVVDTEYSAGFFGQLSPQHLDACLALAGVEPVAPEANFTYCELGCGHGLTAATLAAANPRGKFYAADFMPAHISAAQRLARASGLANIEFLEKSFEQLARGEENLPAFDYVTLHGVYSWVSPENRGHVVDFLARYLKPGGVVYVSYNALPGWAVAAPLQRLVMERTASVAGGSRERVRVGRSFIEQLQLAGAKYFSSNATPVLDERVGRWKTAADEYLAHEYLNQSWEPLYFADVARAMSRAKLDYVTSGSRIVSLFQAAMTEPHRALLAGIEDPLLRESVSDYLRNTSFRGDIYVRGARRLTPRARHEWLGRVGLALTVSLRSIVLTEVERLAPVDTPAQRAALELLAAGPRSFAELIALPGQDPASIETLAAFLLHHQQAALFVIPESRDDPTKANAGGLNTALAEAARDTDIYQVLAAPVIGSGIRASRVQRLVYRAIVRLGEQAPQAEILKEVQATLKPENGDAPAEDLADVVGLVLRHSVQTWRRLGVL